MTSAGALEIHLVESHSQSLHADNIKKLLQMGERKVAKVSEATCPLCHETVSSAKQYMRHVGRHQEDLALFALPKLEVPEEQRQDEDESVVGEHEGLFGEEGANLRQYGLDLEDEDLSAESQTFDADELAQEAIESPSRNEERSSFNLPEMNVAAPSDSATSEQLKMVKIVVPSHCSRCIVTASDLATYLRSQFGEEHDFQIEVWSESRNLYLAL